VLEAAIRSIPQKCLSVDACVGRWSEAV